LRRAAALLAGLAVVLAAAAGLTRIRFDDSAERFFPRDDPTVERFRRSTDLFPAGESARLLVDGPGLWTREGVEAVRALERAAAEVEGVADVLGPTRLFADADASDPAAVRRELLADPLVRSAGLVADDGSAVALTLIGRSEAPGGSPNADAVDALGRTPPPGVEVSIWSLAALRHAFDCEVRSTLTRLLPAALLVVGLVLVAAGGSLAGAMPALLTVVLVELVTLGAFGFAGETLDVVSSLVAPLLLVVTAASAIHLQAWFRRRLRAGDPPAEAARTAARERGWAVVWAGVTTSVAFGSLAVSPIEPVATLGRWCAIGIALQTVVSRLLLPRLLALGRWGTPEAPSALERASVRGSSRVVDAARRSPGRVLALAGALSAISALGLASLRLESDLAGYLPSDHPMRAVLDRFESHGLGSTRVDLILPSPPPAGGSYLEPFELDRLAALSAALRDIPGVATAIGAGDLFRAAERELVRSSGDSEATRWLTLALLRAHPEASARLDLLARPEAARLVVLTAFAESGQGRALLGRIERLARHAGYPDAYATGAWAVLVRGQEALFRTLVISLGVTALLIALAWWAALRRAGAALVALAPNLWTVLVVLGGAAALGVAFEAPTVMTASVLLGLAVDDTFHTLGHLRRHRDGDDLGDAFRGLAPGHVTSSLTLAAGFAVIGFASMAPIARFGALMAVGTLVALVGDLVVLPALLSSRSARRANGSSASG